MSRFCHFLLPLLFVGSIAFAAPATAPVPYDGNSDQLTLRCQMRLKEREKNRQYLVEEFKRRQVVPTQQQP